MAKRYNMYSTADRVQHKHTKKQYLAEAVSEHLHFNVASPFVELLQEYSRVGKEWLSLR